MPESNLKVAVMPHDIIENDAKANIEAVSRRISSIDPDTDLLVLPEMFNTGYSNIREQLRLNAEPDNGPTMQAVEGWAKDYNMAIWGGFTAVDEKDRIYNRGFMTDPDGNTVFYDKRHLFRMGGEHNLLRAGDSLSPVISYCGWKLKMAICYDIRFPVWNRNVANEYDALIVPANWAHSRVYAWRQMLIARAIPPEIPSFSIIGATISPTDATTALYMRLSMARSLMPTASVFRPGWMPTVSRSNCDRYDRKPIPLKLFSVE